MNAARTRNFPRRTLPTMLGAVSVIGALAFTAGPAPALASTSANSAAVRYSSAHPYPTLPAFKGKATITWWSWDEDAPTLVKMFEKQYPNIHVTVADVGASTTLYPKLLAALKAGSGAPGVSQMEYPYLPEFVATGKVMNIAKYVNPYQSYFPRSTWALVSLNKGTYAVPIDWGTNGYAYRPDIFKKYGLTVPKTWAQFASDAVTLHKANPHMYLAGFPMDNNYVMDILWQAGVQIFKQLGPTSWAIDMTSPAAQHVMGFWGNLIKKGAILPIEQYTAPDDRRMATGVYASYVVPTWGPTYLMLPAIKPGTQHFLLTRLPSWNSKPTTSSDVASTDLVTDQCPVPEACALLAAFVGTQQEAINNLQLPGTSHGGGTFAASKARATVPSINALNPLFGTQKILRSFGTYTSDIPATFQYSPWTSEMTTVIGAQLVAAANGHQPWSAVLRNTQAQVAAFARAAGYTITVGKL